MNRRKQIEKQKHTAALRSLQKPVSRTKKALGKLNGAIRTKRIALAVIGAVMLLALLRSAAGYTLFGWQQQTIRFESLDEIHYTTRGHRVTHYLLTDRTGNEYRIRSAEFPREAFEANVKPEDVLKITWHKYLWDKDIEAVSDAENVYLPYDSAVANEKRFASHLLIFSAVLLLPGSFITWSLAKSLRRREECFAQLQSAEEALGKFQNSTE